MENTKLFPEKTKGYQSKMPSDLTQIELPPGWTWHSNNGKPNQFIKWRAVGPVVSGKCPLEAYGRLKSNQTPEAAAEDAWRQWERLSGVKRETWNYLQKCKKIMELM